MAPYCSKHYFLSYRKEKPKANSFSILRALRPGSTKAKIVPRFLPRLHLSVTRASQEASTDTGQSLQYTKEAGGRKTQALPLALNTAPCNSSGPLGFQNPTGPGACRQGHSQRPSNKPSPPLGFHLLLHVVDHDKMSLPGMRVQTVMWLSVVTGPGIKQDHKQLLFLTSFQRSLKW